MCGMKFVIVVPYGTKMEKIEPVDASMFWLDRELSSYFLVYVVFRRKSRSVCFLLFVFLLQTFVHVGHSYTFLTYSMAILLNNLSITDRMF